jgi:AP-3 complex subunit delta
VKYLGLLALSKLMPVAPKAIQEHREMVINCLDDEDVTIRLRALDLIVGMVNKRNLMDIIKKLMDKLHDAEGGYQDDLIAKIIDICSQNSYAHITDFEWYITVLVELTHVQGTTHGKRISDQLLDVCIRVQVIQEFGVKNMVSSFFSFWN